MDTELRDALLGKYQVRKSAAEKQAFREYVKQYCEEKGIPCAIEEEKGSANIVLGNPDAARMVFTAHYDTCAWMPLPNIITPLNKGVYIFAQTALALAMLLPAAALGLAVGKYVGANAGRAVFSLAALGTFWQMLYGRENRHTANDNTSGVAVILEAAACKPEGAAFVLFDNEEKGMLGSKAFMKRHKEMAGKVPLINFDCVSDGDSMLLAISKQANDLPCLEEIRKSFRETARRMDRIPLDVGVGRAIYSSDQMNYPYGMAVAALKRGRGGLYYLDRIHTHRDTNFDERNIDCCADWISELSSRESIQPSATAKKLPNPTKRLWIALLIGAAVGFAAGYFRSMFM